jgi:hypothetical protein
MAIVIFMVSGMDCYTNWKELFRRTQLAVLKWIGTYIEGARVLTAPCHNPFDSFDL